MSHSKTMAGAALEGLMDWAGMEVPDIGGLEEDARKLPVDA